MDSVVLDNNSAIQYLERRLQENDVKGAIEFAIRRQNMFPKLKRLLRFLGNIIVQVSTDGEEIDWYSVLGVDPTADIKTMKQHYVKLAKNNRLKSREAHKLLNKAWDTLSNKFTRKEYDLRRRLREKRQNAFVVKQSSSATQLLQPAPVLQYVSGNNTSGLRLVSPAAQAIQPAPDLYNISRNKASNLTSVCAATKSTQLTPDMYSVSGNKEGDPGIVSSAPQLLQPASGMHNVSGNNGCAVDLMQPAPYLYNVLGNNGRVLTTIASDTHFIQPPQGQYNVSGNRGNGPMLVCSPAQSIQPAPSMYNVSGNRGSSPRLVFSATQSILPAPCIYNVSGNRGSGPRLVSLAAQPIQLAPGMYNESGNKESIPRLVSSATQSFHPASDLCNGLGINGSGLGTFSSEAQLFQSARVNLKRPYVGGDQTSVNLKRRYVGGDQTSATKAKSQCIYMKESGISLPPVAGLTGSTHIKHKERMKLVEDTCDSSKYVPENHMPNGNNGHTGIHLFQMENSRAEMVGVFGSRKENSKKKLADALRNLLMMKARNVILDKLNERNAAIKDNNEHNPADDRENAATEGPKEDGLKTMEVPDPEFHDFDNDRTQESFSENQVWAVYDEDDGMPRLYALIQKASKRPFKLQISWLNSKSNMELESIKWMDSGFHKTCGDFCVGKEKLSIELNSFSHRVAVWKKAAKVFQIFPKKGDVWALYRNWTPNWNEHTTEEEKHKYDMVEVLEDYDEEKGVTIVPLVKVSGFKAVFCQHSDAKEVRTIPKKEIFRFSHQVSSYLLTDQEAPNVLKGSKELDPAAMPLELLQVIH